MRESIGRYLARQRKLRGIALEELAAQTRIPLRSLERLEAGAFDVEPDGFARGFVRTVAQAIGLDPDETVARMLDEPGPDARVSIGFIGRALMALAALLVLGVVGAVGWASLRSSASEGEVATLAEPPPDTQRLPVRRDAVSALAREIGAALAASEAVEATAATGEGASAAAPDEPAPPVP